jgi:transcriptional regulator CtsR
MNSETVLKQHMHSGLILYLLPRRLKSSQSYTLLCVRPGNQTIGDTKVIYADCQETVEELIVYVKTKNNLQESEKPDIVSLLKDLATQEESLRHERLQERLMDMTEAELYRFVNRRQ